MSPIKRKYKQEDWKKILTRLHLRMKIIVVVVVQAKVVRVLLVRKNPKKIINKMNLTI